MCYNNVYALKIAEQGAIVQSKKGHDSGRIYLVIAAVSDQFVLLCDGKTKTVNQPKLKRIKHLKYLGKDQLQIKEQSLEDSQVIQVLKNFSTTKNKL